MSRLLALAGFVAARAVRRRLDEAETGFGGEEIDEVADVDHAARIVERFAVDRQARMAGGAEQGEHLAQGRVGVQPR